MTNFKETFLYNDFDLVWKNLFDQKSSYLPVITNKMNYPVDIYTTDKGIAKRDFDFAWKISKELDLSKAEASMAKGLLIISIPYAKDRAPKQIVIK